MCGSEPRFVVDKSELIRVGNGQTDTTHNWIISKQWKWKICGYELAFQEEKENIHREGDNT